ncbi:MAG: energy transducer TonB [Pyrinomonadaceae bacterium]
MPLNVRRFGTSVLGFLLFSATFLSAQTAPTSQTAQVTPPVVPPMGPPTSGDIMRDRISKSKAFIAVRNYNAAIYELENIRKESSDSAVQGVVNVLLMNSYLEQGDYKRAQDLLNEFYAAQKTTKPNASTSYMAVAGQIVKGARSRVERYRALGLSVSDRTLPLEALNDLEKMRETLELVITQSKEIGGDKNKMADAMMMLEEASNSRSMLARDDYDSRRWKDEVADTREKMVRSNSVVMSAVNDPASDALLAANNKPAEPKPLFVPPTNQPATQQPVMQPVSAAPTPNPTREREVKVANNSPAETTTAQIEKPVYVPETARTQPVVPKEEPKQIEPTPAEPKQTEPKQVEPKPVEAKVEAPKDGSPMSVGSLLPYATAQAKPVYPQAAKVVRAAGVVTVEVTIDESGTVAEVQKTSGPMMLQAAAKDAIRKWKFKPFVRDGQPVRATGFVNFSFAL